MSHHVEPGNILKRIGGIEMEELHKLIQELELQATEIIVRDEDGNITKKKLY
jgi:hypothetical protein